ncbi:MAG: mechanosensitive ion channel family protein [Syntrophomonas sp.]|uniref:mechanosensitive ion channel family protein n=1 Tax=Syntrophomonas sp. TaxID=2053627 RepID=UPI00262FF3AC|nr:mechanosensitive ion channel family protein [Syntrophomonas sp.]MDD2509773.1 mechanosensitive ion channel family protein [Syntrophomonas sp.]MDD4625734.1 mechanosensitive ion channel family protein [Syntrophomonas sp.]
MCYKSQSNWDEIIIIALGKPLQLLIIVFGLYMALDILSTNISQEQLLLKLFRSSLVAIVGWAFYRLSASTTLFSQKAQERWNIDSILIPLISKTLHFLIIALVIIIIAGELGFDVNGFIAGLGLGGLALALAAKDMLANFFAGMVIVMEKPFLIDDWIETPGVEGTVEDISFRSTKIRKFDQSLVTVPNSTLAAQAITNYSRRGKRRISFYLNMNRKTPKDAIESTIAHIKQMLIEHSGVHSETILVNFEFFAESSFDIMIYFFTNTTDWAEHLTIRQDINLRIIGILEEEGVEISFPSRSLYFADAGNIKS